jgi:signal transduction histidine kinase
MSITPRLRPKPSLVLSYVLAVVLPVAGSFFTQHVQALRVTPFAAHFIAVVCVAAIGGFAPAMLSLAVSVCLRNLLHVDQLDAVGLPQYHVVQVGVLALGALVVSIARNSRLRSQQSLEGTLSELQERNSDLITSLGNSKCACWTFDLDSGLTPRWYAGSYPVFGRPFAEVEDLPSLLPLVHPEDHHHFPTLIGHLQESQDPIVFEYRCTWPNGELHWLEMRATRVPEFSCAWRGVTLDITDRKQAEFALLRAEKLAAMGRLASTVAHEINNPLEAVTNLLYLASADEALDETTRGYLGAAERELARLSNITRLTLGFVRIGGATASVDVAVVVEEVLGIFQHRLEARGVRLELDCTSGVLVQMPPHELRQIVTNLVANAVDAVSAEDGAIAVRVQQHNGCAVLIVEDNGEGILAHDLGRIFEAFFSTKEEVGTGIGLWVSKELAEKNGGAIAVESTRDRGTLPGGVSTVFRVELPLVAPIPYSDGIGIL